MNWLTPLPAIAAAAVAVPALVILYFLKLRRRDVEVSTTLLWRKAIQDLQANAPFQRLRRNILLILQLIVLAGILLAMAQPQITGQTVTGRKHIILIDRSGSMTATDAGEEGGPPLSRLALAKRKAGALVKSLREGGIIDKASADEAMVIAFDATAEVRQPFTSDKAALVAAIESISPVEGPTAIEEAMRLANAHKPQRIVEDKGLDTGDPVTFHLYSDGRLPDADRARPGPDDTFAYHRVGRPDAANIGIIGLRSERGFDNPSRLGVFVALQNGAPQARAVDVELLIDGVVAGIKGVTVGAAATDPLRAGTQAEAAARIAEERAAAATLDGSPTPPAPTPAFRGSSAPGVGGAIFQFDRPAGALIQVRLRSQATGEELTDDAMLVDNRAWLVVPPARKMAVAVVGQQSLYLSTALSGLPLSRLAELTPGQYEERVRAGTMGEFDVVVLDGYLPPTPAGGAGPSGLPPGRFIVLNAVPGGSSGIVDKGKGGMSGIVDWSRDHPTLRSVNLDALAIGESRRVELLQGSPATAIAMTDAGPAVLELSTAETRAIIVPFDVAASNWPFDVGFVVFLASAITYVGEDGGAGAEGRLVQPGGVLSDRLPAGAESVEMKTAAGETHQLTPAADGRVVFGPLATTGVYEVSWKGAAGATDVTVGGRSVRTYASNLLDPAESNAGAAEELALASKVVAAEARRSADADRRLWPWLLLAALGVVMLEWFIYNRKVHV